MAEYIEREDAKKYLAEYGFSTPCGLLDYVPAANVQPVVLCKDCGHWNKENQHLSKRSRNSVAMCAWFSRNYGTIETSEGDWCSYGYRREER